MQLAEPIVAEPTRNEAPSSFREVVAQNKERIYYLALDLTGNHHDAEDLSQEVFIKAYRKLDTFRGEAQLHTWLYRITVNTFLNKKRKKALAFMKLRDDFGGSRFEQDNAAPPDQQIETESVQRHVEQAMKTLSPRERTAFVLRHDHDLSIKEVAAMMEVAEGTVKSMLYRCMQKLRKELAFYREELGLT